MGSSPAGAGSAFVLKPPSLSLVPELPDPLVFVGGAQRSGTTLLRNMLTAHPRLAIPDESWFVHDVHWQLERLHAAGDLRLAWRLIGRRPRFQQWHLPTEVVEDWLKRWSPDCYADLIRILFAAYARSRGKPYAGDKTTSNALHFHWLSELFPRSRFIHVLRDPRESCMSLAVQPFSRGGLTGAALGWRAHVAAARGASAVLGSRLLEVRYGDLVREPRQQLERICRFLEIPLEEAMLRYDSCPEVLPKHHQDVLAREPLQADRRRWQDELSRDDIALIEFIAGELMEQVGYERHYRRLTPRSAAALLRDQAELAQRRRLRRPAG